MQHAFGILRPTEPRHRGGAAAGRRRRSPARATWPSRCWREIELPEIAGRPRGVRLGDRAAHPGLPRRVRGARGAAATPRRRAAAARAGATLMAAGLHPTAALGRCAADREGALPPARPDDAQPDPPHARVRAARARRRARPGVGDPDAERAARAPPAAAGAERPTSPYWFGADSGLASARFSIVRAYPRRGVPRCVSRLGRVCRDGARPRWGRRGTSTTTRSSGGTCAPIRALGTVEVREMDVQPSLEDAARWPRWCRRWPRRRSSEPPPREHPHAEAIAESSFRASRDGLDATILHDGRLRAAARRGARDGGVGARPCARARLRRRPRGRRAHPARGRWRGAPARGVRARTAWTSCSTQLVRDTQGARMAELILGPMLRYLDETQATVWVETDGALRGRGARPHASARSASRATTTRSSRSPDSSRARRIRTRCALDGERALAARAGSEFPPSAIRHDRPGAAAEDRVRLVPRRGAARGAVEPQPATRTSAAARSTRCTRSRCA